MQGNEKILIVDDSPHVLKLLKISLEKAGYEIYTAEDGDQGLELTKKIQPDLIISDVMMPRTDGIEFCWMIRENSSVPMVPFIFMTSLEDQDMEIRGFRAGADEYLIKPVDRNILLEKVRTLLDRSKRLKSMDNESSAPVVGFEGSLADLSLVEVIQLLNLNKRDGTLEFLGKERGKIVFDKGSMIYAEAGEESGVEAVNLMVTIKKGTFKFEPVKEEVKSNIEGSTMNILLEACRLMDEANFKSKND